MSTPTQPVSGEDLGTLLGRSFSLFFAQIGQYLLISLIVLAPLFLISVILTALFVAAGAGVAGTQIGAANLFALGVGVGVTVSILSLVGGAFVLGALVHGAKTQIGGGSVSIGEAYKAAAGKWLSLVAITIVVGIAVGLGSLLLVLPGLAAFFFLCLSPIAVMADDARTGQALSKSCSLVLRVPGEVIVVALISFVAMFVLGSIPVIGWLSNCLVLPWTMIALTLAYEKARRLAAAV